MKKRLLMLVIVMILAIGFFTRGSAATAVPGLGQSEQDVCYLPALRILVPGNTDSHCGKDGVFCTPCPESHKCVDGVCMPKPKPDSEPKLKIVQFGVLWSIQGWARLGWVDGEGLFNPSTNYIRFSGPNEVGLYWVDFFLNAETYNKNVVVEVSYIDKTRAGFSLAPREWPRRTGEVRWIK